MRGVGAEGEDVDHCVFLFGAAGSGEGGREGWLLAVLRYREWASEWKVRWRGGRRAFQTAAQSRLHCCPCNAVNARKNEEGADFCGCCRWE